MNNTLSYTVFAVLRWAVLLCLGHAGAASNIGCITVNARCEQAEPRLDVVYNSNLLWQHTYFGLQPQLRGMSTADMTALGEVDMRKLEAMLAVPERAAAAHVVLTYAWGHTWNVDSETWNGLAVAVAGEQVRYDGVDDVRAMWHERLGH